MSPPILALEGLDKAFGALTVTDDLSLTVAEGEIHAVIGPNSVFCLSPPLILTRDEADQIIDAFRLALAAGAQP